MSEDNRPLWQKLESKKEMPDEEIIFTVMFTLMGDLLELFSELAGAPDFAQIISHPRFRSIFETLGINFVTSQGETAAKIMFEHLHKKTSEYLDQ